MRLACAHRKHGVAGDAGRRVDDHAVVADPQAVAEDLVAPRECVGRTFERSHLREVRLASSAGTATQVPRMRHARSPSASTPMRKFQVFPGLALLCRRAQQVGRVIGHDHGPVPAGGCGRAAARASRRVRAGAARRCGPRKVSPSGRPTRSGDADRAGNDRLPRRQDRDCSVGGTSGHWRCRPGGARTPPPSASNSAAGRHGRRMARPAGPPRRRAPRRSPSAARR